MADSALKRLELRWRSVVMRTAARLAPRPLRAGPPDWDARPYRVLYLRYWRASQSGGPARSGRGASRAAVRITADRHLSSNRFSAESAMSALRAVSGSGTDARQALPAAAGDDHAIGFR